MNNYCAGCGGAYVLIDGFCGECWIGRRALLRHCPHCGYPLDALVDQTVAERVRSASWDVSGAREKWGRR